MNHPAIEDVRGNGCLWGVEVRDSVDTNALTEAFVDNGILTKETRHRTFRFAPPIVISDTEVNEVCARFERSLRQVAG
jgi:ornithine--oxo-acid transaminase